MKINNKKKLIFVFGFIIICSCDTKDDECNLKHIFEVGIGKKYFSIKKNRHMYQTLFFIKHISPLKDTERLIAEFLI